MTSYFSYKFCKRKLCTGSCVQAILIVVLITTVIFNVMFILDNKSRLTSNNGRGSNVNNREPIDENVEDDDENKFVQLEEKLPHPGGAHSDTNGVYVSIKL